ncbi:MAG TPA: hypothetical protein VNL18_15770 [Gemmatimonadales bacterium]|nr:hypothetical protein [Gemmatimonadales bacterium]
MRWTGAIGVAAAIAGGLCGPAPSHARAQTGAYGHAPLSTPEFVCGGCHASHAADAGYVLLADRTGTEIHTWLNAQAPGARTSAACLRCHWTEEVRLRQPDLQAVQWDPGRYVGPDLSDDHPLGSLATLASRSVGRAGFWVPLQLGPAAEPGSGTIECARCHLPHEPSRLQPPPAQHAALCGTCHAAESASLGDHNRVACAGCHALHNRVLDPLLRGVTLEGLCRSCHTSTGIVPDSMRVYLLGDEPGGLSPWHNPGSTCTRCHAIHR